MPICGQLQVPLEQVVAEPPALSNFPESEHRLPSIRMQAAILTLTGSRHLRICYNLAIGFPSLRTYGARNLLDLKELEAADRRKAEERQAAFQALRRHAEEMGEIYRMAGIE